MKRLHPRRWEEVSPQMTTSETEIVAAGLACRLRLFDLHLALGREHPAGERVGEFHPDRQRFMLRRFLPRAFKDVGVE